jgi:hypothetical protein
MFFETSEAQDPAVVGVAVPVVGEYLLHQGLIFFRNGHEFVLGIPQ